MDMTTSPISKLLLKLSPPVMLALLIQSVYNVVDSFFVARYSSAGLTALSIIFPMQLLMTAIATGTGAGVNLLISRMDGAGERKKQSTVMVSGLILNVFNFLIFALIGIFFSTPYLHISSADSTVRELGITYMKIVFTGSIGLFTESICTKILQARGNMTLPMIAQVLGAVINVILDPVLIFGRFGLPKMGIAGAAVASVIGQFAAMVVTLAAVLKSYDIKFNFSLKTCVSIYQNASGSIVTQSLYTLYIIGLNMILKLFTEDAVTVLGIYYKIQSFFFIPLLGFQQVLLPLISNNFGARQTKRIKQIVKLSVIISSVLMCAAMIIFLIFPRQLLSIFSSKGELINIGIYAFRVISLSFVPAGITIVITSYLQGIAQIKSSVIVIILRQVILLVPVAYLLHFISLNAVWWTFPITEFISALVCFLFEKKYRNSY